MTKWQEEYLKSLVGMNFLDLIDEYGECIRDVDVTAVQDNRSAWKEKEVRKKIEYIYLNELLPF